ncbi:MAG TPA: type II toxin-antitoxin system VapC family toxin [Candidatus Sulfotelmatobacter sp.]|nr:type II toxin-antitoxin system VapC family toxin [Candidatus Sulfotelmatobacter sp.]
MILDSSVIVAILRAEPEARDFSRAIASAAQSRISAANYLEAAVVIDGSRSAISSRRFDEFFRASRIAVEAVTPSQAEIARRAYYDFGKTRHKAGLNFCDCFAYALAKEMDEPLLFKGDDFRRTDIEAAKTGAAKR